MRLRRAAALRTAEEYDRAAQLAREVRELAVERQDRSAELAACMELGQDLVHATAGEAFTPVEREVDLDGADEAFRRAIELARELGDDPTLAAALREAGVVQLGRVRAWFVEQMQLGAHIAIGQRVAAGEVLEEMLPEFPIAPVVYEASALFEEALELFERLGDRRGVMASIIAMGYLNWAPDIHLGSGAARHIEEIRRLTSKAKAFTNESERAAFEAQMLYGVHVFARAKVIPDLALSRGEQAHAHAREIGDRSLEFLAAGGTAMAHLDMGEVEEARSWLDRAAAIASEHPTPLRARRLETWRGLARSTAGDAAGMRQHLERAVQLASASGLAAVKCEALGRLALEASRLGVELADDDLLELAERSAAEAAGLAAALPGHPAVGSGGGRRPRAGRAFTRPDRGSRGARARGDGVAGVGDARGPVPGRRAAGRERPDGERRPRVGSDAVPTATHARDDRAAHDGRGRARALVPRTDRARDDAAGGADRGRLHRRGRHRTREGGGAEEEDAQLLRSLVQGKTNREIADEIGIDEEAVTRRLGELFARIGASSRAEATAFAFHQRVL